PCCCRPRFWERLFWRKHTVPTQRAVTVSQAGISESIAWVLLKCLLEMCDGLLESLRRPLAPVVAPFKIKLIGLRVLRVTFGQPLLLFSRQPQSQPLGDFL